MKLKDNEREWCKQFNGFWCALSPKRRAEFAEAARADEDRLDALARCAARPSARLVVRIDQQSKGKVPAAIVLGKFKALWLSIPIAERGAFAASIGSNLDYCNMIAHGRKPINVALAVRIEQATRGKLRAEELHPGKSPGNPLGFDWEYVRPSRVSQRSTAASCNA